jgi:hypothetical protein
MTNTSRRTQNSCAEKRGSLMALGVLHPPGRVSPPPDTLIHVDLPLLTHYRWVTKRFIKGLFMRPEGWPEHSPMWSSTISSYRVLPLCHCHLTPRYRQLVADAAASKRVHHLRSPAQIHSFLEAVRKQCG